MKNSLVTAIVPQLPPAIDGLGDYGLNLARQLYQDFGVQTRFLVGNPSWLGDGVTDFEVAVVAERSAAALLRLLPTDSTATVLLHYVGYGYARRGCPGWLVQGLRAWRGQSEARRLVTMFHELYARRGSIWNSQFWTSDYQRFLATRLMQGSDRCVTSNPAFAQLIEQFSQGKHCHVPILPVFSNIGEPKVLLPLADRARRLVVFGGRGPRSRVYRRSLTGLVRACEELQIDEVLDIGPPLADELPEVTGRRVKALGILPSHEISELLATSYAGFFDYPITFLGKSTVFAAYCAHRVLPVGGSYPVASDAGIMAGQHYWQVEQDAEGIDEVRAQRMADVAYGWYEGHCLNAQARMFAEVLSSFKH